MQHRHLSRSGLLVSEISYGNWITHDSQGEADAAIACVREALDCGITTVAWVLGNPNVSSAIVGATRPEQVRDNAAASGVVLDESVRERIDAVLGDFVERDPAKTQSPRLRP